MTRPAATVQLDRPLVELARAFTDSQLGAVAVTDKLAR
jgi:hypothetical protein